MKKIILGFFVYLFCILHAFANSYDNPDHTFGITGLQTDTQNQIINENGKMISDRFDGIEASDLDRLTLDEKNKLVASVTQNRVIARNTSSGKEFSSDDLKPTNTRNSPNPTSGDLKISGVFTWFKGELLTVTFIIAVAVFVFIGARMVVARGNPEEFKKAWMHFVYAIIGIFIVFSAWGIVNLIANLGSNF